MFDYDVYYIETYWGYDIFYDSYTDTHFVPEISETKDFYYLDEAEDFIRWYEGY